MNENRNKAELSALPWWTWILPFFIANLGTWLSVWFKTDPGASLWYLPTALGIVMAYWWGPRVLFGIYLNAVVCAPLWDLPWQWSFLYALPETIEVGLSWLFFIKIVGGKYWLPDLKNVGGFLLFGSVTPTVIANAYLVMQLYLLGDIPQNAIWDNWQVVLSADLATQFVLAVPLLVLFTKPMQAKGWTQTKDNLSQVSLLPDNRNSLRDIVLIIVILGIALIAILVFPIHDLWILYGFLMIFIAIRYGVNMAIIGTSWIGILTFLVPVILTGKLGLATATYGDFVSTNFDILFLCGVTLLTGRTISDLFMEITERKRAEEQVSLLQTITLEVAAARDLSSALQVVLRRVCEKTGWVYGQAWVPRRDKSVLDCDAAWFLDTSLEKFRVISMGLTFPPGRGLPGRVLLSKQPVWLEDATLDPNFPRAESAVESGLKAALAVPILADGEIVAVIEFFLHEQRTEDERLVKVIAAVAAQLGLVLERKRVEGLLEERQHLLQKILDTEPGTVYIYDLEERRNVYINRYWLLAFGYTEEETQAMGDQLLIRIFHPDDLARISMHHANWQQADGGDIREIEYRVRSKDGEWCWLHSHETAFARDESGRVKQILGISYEITERKLAQEALRRSEQQLGLIYDTVSDIIFLLSIEPDEHYRFVSVNQAFLQTTGLKSAQVIGSYADEIIPSESQQLVFGNYKRAIQERIPVTWEEVSEYPAGQKTAIVTVNAVYNEEAICTHLVGAVHDITERKQMEKVVVEERDFSDAILNSLPGVFYFYDHAGKFMRWNKNFEIVSGYSAIEIAQMHPLDFFKGKEKEYLAERIQQVFERGESDAEAPFTAKNGESLPYYFTGKRIEMEGQPYLIGMGIDITRRKQAEEELAKRAEQMRALASYVESVREDERTRIAREIHDEFGQFLTALKMDLAWVSRRLPANDEKRERLNQASVLVDENVIRVQRIATELRPGLLDDLGLVTALDWPANEFSKHTGLLCELNLPEQDLKLDPALNTTLFRIFQETLTNVVRHAQASRVNVSLQKQEPTLILSIQDNGRGITEAELNDPNSLGLLGLRERVAQWEGELSIRGEAGRGTTVTVQIPLSKNGDSL